MSWEKEMDDAIAAHTPLIQVWDAQKGKLVHVEPEPRPFDGQLVEHTGTTIKELTVGSITFSADASAPCHCANCVVLQQDVDRLRRGNAELLTMNSLLQRELNTKNVRMARIVELESANKHLQDTIQDLRERVK